jgi:hypothetical protein
MRWVGLLVILLGLAGVVAFSKPELRWESAGAAVVGLVLILTAKIDSSPRR